MSGFRWILLLLVLIVGGPFVLWMGYDESSTMRALADHGKSVDASVEEITWNKKRGSESGFKAKVNFTTEDQQAVTDKVDLPSDLGKQLRDAPESEAATLKVRYLPEDPHRLRLATHTDTSTGMFAGGAAMLVIGLGLLAYRVRRKPVAVAVAEQPA
ncbi:MAG: DUF3592 domain-containing protein [Tahibacter sp.]